MPQGKRKTPFSAKQKKSQLQQKRERKQGSSQASGLSIMSKSSSKESNFGDVNVINEQPTCSGTGRYNPNRYRLVFKKENNEAVKQRLEMAHIPYKQLPENALEVSYEDVFTRGPELDMPKRPPWDFSLSKEKLELQEQRYFREYIEKLESKFEENELSHYEMNLETWRQLWRVVEFSDIVLQVVDIRFSVYHFSPALYHYVTNDLKKSMILVINKIDLVPAPLVLAWQEYFKKHFPMIKVMCFASFAGMILKGGKLGKRIGNLHMAVAGARELLKICEEIVEDKVDLSSWKQKINSEAASISSTGDDYEGSDSEEDSKRKTRKPDPTQRIKNDTSYYVGERYQDNILTIGFVGHPNVGKSSFLNAICGKKVVSVSRTPGHTKHFQTIMLTKNVRLCDCPGLVFPSLVPKAIQVLMGCYPIAQLREPYSAIAYLGERMKLHDILKIKHPSPENYEDAQSVEWSSFDICEAWAIKKGFRTAKTARPDVYRAANHILRMALDGRTICLAFYPPNFTKEKAMWSAHPNLKDILAVQAYRKNHNDDDISTVSSRLFDVVSVSAEFDEESPESSEEANEEESEDNEADSEGSIGAPLNKFSVLTEEM